MSSAAALFRVAALCSLLPAALAHGDMDDEGDMSDEAKLKQQVFVAVHALLGTLVAWVTLPAAVAMVAGRQPDKHKIFMAGNACLLFFSTLVAILQFAEGTSKHGQLASFCVACWALQTMYGIVRHFFFRTTWPVKPHRAFGVLLVGLTMLTWLSGVLHVQDSCPAGAKLQLCQAHLVLASGLVLVGVAHLYYHEAHASVAENWIVSLLVLCEVAAVVGVSASEAAGGALAWSDPTKMLHLGAALVWLLAAGLAAACLSRHATRGLGFTLGLALHVCFVVFNSVASSDRARSARVLHVLAVLPILLARPRIKQGWTAFLCVVAGFAFAASADPIAADALVPDAPTYGFVVFLCALAFFAVHVCIQRFVVSRPAAQDAYPDTLLERAGFAGPCQRCVNVACCCLGAGRPAVEDEEVGGGKDRYLPVRVGVEMRGAGQAAAGNGGEEDDDEDVTQAPPPAKPPKPAMR